MQPYVRLGVLAQFNRFGLNVLVIERRCPGGFTGMVMSILFADVRVGRFSLVVVACFAFVVRTGRFGIVVVLRLTAAMGVGCLACMVVAVVLDGSRSGTVEGCDR